MSAERAAVEPQAYRMVAFLEKEVRGRDLEGSHVMNLAALLQKNGLLQVAVFLEVKGRADAKDKPAKPDERLRNRGARQAGAAAREDKPAKPDENLRKLLEDAMRQVVGDFKNRDGAPFALKASYLSKLDMGQALLLEEIAVEAATWIRRLHEAMADNSASGATPEGDGE